MSLSSFILHKVKWFQVLLYNSYNSTLVICLDTFKWINKICMISWSVILFLNDLELICLHTSIVIVSTQLHGFNYSNQTLMILFNINHLFAHSEVVTRIAIKQ